MNEWKFTDVFLEFGHIVVSAVGGATVGNEPGHLLRLSLGVVPRGSVGQRPRIVGEWRESLVRCNHRRISSVCCRPIHL